jgi:hypothetical protein
MTFGDWYQVKLFIEHASGISMDALHIFVGFTLFLLLATVLKRGLGSFLPWLVLLMLELANEAYDLRVERWPDLASQIGESVKDVLLTMALPTLMLFLVRRRPHWLLGNLPTPID